MKHIVIKTSNGAVEIVDLARVCNVYTKKYDGERYVIVFMFERNSTEITFPSREERAYVFNKISNLLNCNIISYESTKGLNESIGCQGSLGPQGEIGYQGTNKVQNNPDFI